MFIGDKGSGKTSLIQVFLNQTGKKEISPSAPLEYYHGKKTSISGTSKEVSHIYEVGGGKAFCELIKIPISNEKLQQSIIVIVLDLSKLNTFLTTLKFWISAIQQQIELIEKENKSKKSGAINETGETIWESHEDKKYITPLQIPVIVVANKYDKFISEDP